ncbi:MAG: threonine dehydratase [Alphaproteobacteria bacterium]|nr:threonine dehydratase [Alphaproteobacteria bacterium]
MSLPDRAALEAAAAKVHAVFGPTPQFCWPLLCARAAAEVWVKHENHTPIGAFKVRGGIVHMDRVKQTRPGLAGVVTATRGNHGQSVALAARAAGLAATVVVPHGNSVEKNAAMRAQGAAIVEHGDDFQDAYEFARAEADRLGLHFVDSFQPDLVEGVGTYALELFSAVPDIDTVYVPIGLGSGICGTMAARDALGLRTKVVGVVAAGAPAYALSFAAGRPVSTNAVDTMADGVACRVPNAEAFAMIKAGAERIVTVDDAAIAAAMRHYFTDTHNVAEGAGAAPLAALLQERAAMAGRRVAVILSGGNVDRAVYAPILAAKDAA